jgi:uncharacterized membrane protein YdjX (TVP38/TMEM64 family)
VNLPPSLRPHLRLLGVVLLLSLLFAVSRLSGLSDHLSLAYLHQSFVDHAFTGMMIFILAFSLGNLLQIPGLIFLGAAVLALGRGWGALATYAAASISCVITFFVVRALGGDALRQLRHGLAVRILAGLHARPVGCVALLRLLMQTAPALNYVLAMSGLRFRHYLAGTLLGLPLPIALYCYFFDQLAMLLHVHY